MKSFKLVAYQDGAALSREFALNEDKAERSSVIVGTSINMLFNDLDNAKLFKCRIFDSRKPINIRIEHKESGLNVDSALMDLGIAAYKGTYTSTLKLNSSAASRTNFAKRIWASYNSLTATLQVREIQDVISENYANHLKIMDIRKAEKAKELPAASPVSNEVKNDIVTEPATSDLLN